MFILISSCLACLVLLWRDSSSRQVYKSPAETRQPRREPASHAQGPENVKAHYPGWRNLKPVAVSPRKSRQQRNWAQGQRPLVPESVWRTGASEDGAQSSNGSVFCSCLFMRLRWPGSVPGKLAAKPRPPIQVTHFPST